MKHLKKYNHTIKVIGGDCMGKHGIVCEKGVNDMPYGWIKADEYNKRVYQVWCNMIERCYSSKYHEKQPTYKECIMCERWLKLSNFLQDICKIDNYEYWLNHPNERVALDKDIKSNGENKKYSLENCMFTSQLENTRQANKTRDNKHLYNRTGKNNPNHGELVAQIDKNTNKIINLKYNREYIKLGFNCGAITECCKNKRKTHKSYIFKYISDVSDEQLQEYYKESH